MSSATVRAALFGFFDGARAAATVPGLNTVYAAQPTFVDGAKWQLAKDLGSGSVAYLHLAEDTETRIALPAVTGWKRVDYTVGLVVLYQYVIPPDPAGEDSWAGPLDATIDGLKDLIRSDPNCGVPADIFQTGQAPGGITIRRQLPRRTSGAVLSWNVLEFAVTEIIEA